MLVYTRLAFVIALAAASSAAAQAPNRPDIFKPTHDGLTDAEKSTAFDLTATNRPAHRRLERSTVLPDGTLLIPFGTGYHTVICAMYHITDVVLQPGETVTAPPKPGDPDHWDLEPYISGTGETAVQHVLIKPSRAGIETNTVILTTRRTYNLRLKSTEKQFNPKIQFSFREDWMGEWSNPENPNVLRRAETSSPQRAAKPAQHAPPQQADQPLARIAHNYDFEGEAPWKPIRGWNDGARTVIEFPPNVRYTGLPAFSVVHAHGPLFTEDDKVDLNVHFVDDHRSNPRLLIDGIFDEGLLVAGVGANAYEVTVKRR